MTTTRFLDRSPLWYANKRKCMLHDANDRALTAKLLWTHRIVGNGYETMHRCRFMQDVPLNIRRALRDAENEHYDFGADD